MAVIKRKRKMHNLRHKVAIEHTGFYAYVLRYNEAMQIRNFSQATLNMRDSHIRRFVIWCEERSITTPQEVTKPVLETYQKHLYYYRQATGEPLSIGSRNQYLVSIKQFFKWLTQANYLLYNPASELILPQYHKALPYVLTVEEVENILAQADVETLYGIRDRAIVEVLYSTGIRRAELCHLQLHDVMPARLTLMVRQGKGGKDRLLPLGERAAQWIEHYLQQVRPRLQVDIHNQSLFLNDYGDRFSVTKLGDKVKKLINLAGISAPGACHLLRHAMATHMLENGAEMRFIQAMLGHADFSSTQIYTHVSIRKLQEIHALTHPAKLEDKAALLAALAAEQDEE